MCGRDVTPHRRWTGNEQLWAVGLHWFSDQTIRQVFLSKSPYSCQDFFWDFFRRLLFQLQLLLAVLAIGGIFLSQGWGLSDFYTSSRNEQSFVHLSPFLAFSKRISALTGLKAPHSQHLAMILAAFLGVSLRSFTYSIIFRMRLKETMPWPHIELNSKISLSGKRSFDPQNPRECSTLCLSMPAFRQQV